MRLVDVRSGRELYHDHLDYRSPEHTLVNWAAADARLFHTEIERSVARLSGEIVAQLLTRPPTEIPQRDELAALGIERRPPPRPPGRSHGPRGRWSAADPAGTKVTRSLELAGEKNRRLPESWPGGRPLRRIPPAAK